MYLFKNNIKSLKKKLINKKKKDFHTYYKKKIFLKKL
jgi:hypothetical protein